jgi:hypothetical protein
MPNSGELLHCSQKLDLPKSCVFDEHSTFFAKTTTKNIKVSKHWQGAHVMKPYKTKVRCSTLVGSYIACKN